MKKLEDDGGRWKDWETARWEGTVGPGGTEKESVENSEER